MKWIFWSIACETGEYFNESNGKFHFNIFLRFNFYSLYSVVFTSYHQYFGTFTIHWSSLRSFCIKNKWQVAWLHSLKLHSGLLPTCQLATDIGYTIAARSLLILISQKLYRHESGDAVVVNNQFLKLELHSKCLLRVALPQNDSKNDSVKIGSTLSPCVLFLYFVLLNVRE